jgi:hypothetical protein
MPGVVGVGPVHGGTGQMEPNPGGSDVDPLLHVKVYRLADQ